MSASSQDHVKKASPVEITGVHGRGPLVVGGSALTIIAALVLGVGLGSHLVVRHLVQTLPLWVALALGFRRSRATGWVALPLFLFWFALMAFIWLYLLGISSILSGHFTQMEIAMTIVVGISCAAGIWGFVTLRCLVSGWWAVAIFVTLACVQFVCFRLSLLPGIANR
jgi:hypothetical protein